MGFGGSTDWPFPVSAPPWSLRHNDHIRPVSSPAVASRCSSERESLTSVTLNRNLETTKLSGEGAWTAERGQKPGLLCETVSHIVNTKKKIKSYSSEHTDGKRVRQPYCRRKKVSEVWREAQTSQHAPLAKASSRARPRQSSVL